MKKFLTTLYYVLLYIWMILQNLAGLACLLVLSHEKKEMEIGGETFTWYKCPKVAGSFTLGFYILSGSSLESTIKHEVGHIIQSIYLGPLYLPIVALPSLIHAAFHKKELEYEHFWTEKWADSLASYWLD